jgi:hypothetical protein
MPKGIGYGLAPGKLKTNPGAVDDDAVGRAKKNRRKKKKMIDEIFEKSKGKYKRKP